MKSVSYIYSFPQENFVFVSEMTPLKQESKGEFSEPGPTQEEPFEVMYII